VGQNRSPAPPACSLLSGLGQIFVVGLLGASRAGHDFLDSGQRVTVGGEEPEIVTAGDAVPVVDPVITGFFADGSGMPPSVLEVRPYVLLNTVRAH
jgi:hypothetical protein